MQKHSKDVTMVQNDNNNNDNYDGEASSRTIRTRRDEQQGHIRKALHAVKQKMKQTTTNVCSQLNQTMMQLMIIGMDVAESYRPPRIIKMASEMGLRAGWSMDIITNDLDGNSWDFNIPEMRNRAARRMLEDKPLLSVGSPMCTIHSVINNVNHARMDPSVVKGRFAYARRHLEFAMKLYKLQIQEGRYFLHEHPESASSWDERCVREVLGMKGVNKVIADQCRYGMRSKDKNGEGPARTSIGFMINSPCIAMQLQRRCPNRGGYNIHKHVLLQGGRARAAQVYPPDL